MQKKQLLINWNILSYLISDNFDNTNSIIFMHWRGNDKYSFWKILELCEKQNISFISIDLPGFGESPKPKQDRGIKEYAELIKDFVSKLNLKSINIVWHSFGGRIAIYLSANKLINIKKQVLIGSGGIKPKQNNIRLFFVKLAKNILLALGMKKIYKKLQSKVRSEDYKNAKDMAQIFLNTIDFDLTPLLKQIQTPTKLIWWTDDDQTPLNDGQTMNEQIPNSSLFVVKWWTHFVHIDEYQTVFEEIQKFLLDKDK